MKLTINQTSTAFTKTIKQYDNAGNIVKQLDEATGKQTDVIIRPAIPKFEFPVNLELDLSNEKMQQVLKVLLIQAAKDSIQATDRVELWDKDVIVSKFEESFKEFNEDKFFEAVCLTSSNTFGLRSFKDWVKTILIPAMDSQLPKPMTDAQKKVIITTTNDGKNMNEQSLTTVLAWVERYAIEETDADKAITYLTQVSSTDTQDLASLGF